MGIFNEPNGKWLKVPTTHCGKGMGEQQLVIWRTGWQLNWWNCVPRTLVEIALDAGPYQARSTIHNINGESENNRARKAVERSILGSYIWQIRNLR